MLQKIHNRKSIRLPEYDYSNPGAYFVTVCTQGRVNIFSNIVESETGECAAKLNDAGRMVKKWYLELENKFPDVICGEIIIMPNHVHFIIIKSVRADLGVCPETTADLGVCPDDKGVNKGAHAGAPQRIDAPQPRAPQRIDAPLSEIIQWFKTMTTNEYIRNVKQNGWQPFNKKLWQRNYYEQIVRSDRDYERITEYIFTNPQNWRNDKNFQEVL